MRSGKKGSESSSTGRKTERGVLQAGVAKVDITPHEPTYLCGYSLRKEPAADVHDPIFVRALAFDDGRRRFVMMMADLVGMDGESVRSRIAEATGIDPECVYAGDVHNHASPISSARPKNAPPGHLGNDHTRWFKHFHEAVVQVVRDALATLQPVKIGAGKGSSRIAMNRRKRMHDRESVITFDENAASQSFGEHKTDRPVPIREFEGVVRLGANPAGPIDEEVGVLRIDTLDDRSLAVLINYACHGTSLGGRNASISGDWMGRMMTVVEDRLGVSPIFLQGAAGDVNPRFVGGLDGYVDSFEKTAELGEEFASEVIRVWNGIRTESPAAPTIRAASADILLPRCYRDLYKDFRNTAVVAPTTAVRIDDLTWVNFPGEMFNEIGREVKRASPTPVTFLACCTNGSVGYFPTRSAFGEGGYEPVMSHLDPAAEQHYVRQITELLGRLR